MVGSFSSEPCLVALSLLSLLACHVFESAEVNCTSDEPCAKRGGKDTADTDTGDTGEEPGVPIVGWVTSMTGAERGIVRAFSPADGAIVAEWKDLGVYVGAPWFNPVTGNGILVGVEAIHLLHAGGNAEQTEGGTGTDRFDVSHLGDKMVVALSGGVVSVDEEARQPEELVPYGTLGDIAYLGGNSRVVFFTDLGDGGPDLWMIEGDSEAQLVQADYDTSATRGSNVFVGPEDRPYACSMTGGVYSVDDLIAGKVRAVATLEGGLTDINSCAWDPGDGSWLMYSPTEGVYRVSAAGVTTQVHELSAGYTYDRVYWYGD